MEFPLAQGAGALPARGGTIEEGAQGEVPQLHLLAELEEAVSQAEEGEENYADDRDAYQGRGHFRYDGYLHCIPQRSSIPFRVSIPITHSAPSHPRLRTVNEPYAR